MTASSIPFVVDYVWRGGVQGVQGRAEMGETVNRFFQVCYASVLPSLPPVSYLLHFDLGGYG
jgi:hypothetical protein